MTESSDKLEAVLSLKTLEATWADCVRLVGQELTAVLLYIGTGLSEGGVKSPVPRDPNSERLWNGLPQKLVMCHNPQTLGNEEGKCAVKGRQSRRRRCLHRPNRA